MSGSALVAANALLIAGVFGAGLLAPSEGGHVLVGVAPWAEPGTGERVVAAAGGEIIGSTASGVLAAPGSPGFAGRLYGAGALFVIDANRAVGCTAP